MPMIEITRQNLHRIDFNSIVVFSYAEAGAMGEAGNLIFSTADGSAYHLNYLHGGVSLAEFRRAYHCGSSETSPIPPCTWYPYWLGAGNHLIVHEVALSKLLLEEENEPEQIFHRWHETLGRPLLSKEERYQWLLGKVKHSYPPEGSETELTWCEACSEEINLWTYWQGRHCLSPEILVVGRDWGNPQTRESRAILEGIQQGRPYMEGNQSPTDVHLAYLFQKTFGIDLNQKNDRLFFTNLLLGYRTGNTSGQLNTSLTQDQPFFKELVGILRPKAIICLGGETFDCALAAYGQKPPYSSSFVAALDSGKTVANIDGIHFFGVGHCGNLGCLNRIGNKKGVSMDTALAKQAEDWEKIRLYIENPNR